MIITAIICATVFILFSLTLYIAQGLGDKFIQLKRETYKDMDVLHSKKLKELRSLLDTLIESNSNNRNEIRIIREDVELITAELPDLVKLQKDVDDLKGKVSSQQIGQVFSPRRKS